MPCQQADSIDRMTSRFECLYPPSLYADVFGVDVPDVEPGREVWPRRSGAFIKWVPAHAAPVAGAAGVAADAVSEAKAGRREVAVGQFGLVPRWVKSVSDARLRSPKLADVRSETVSTARPTLAAWAAGQRCIVPVQAFFVDDLRSGKAVLTRIARVDGKAMGLAGVWEQWSKDGETITSFTLLTVNANSHALMRRYGHDGSEKRMPAVLSEGAYDAWLGAHPNKAREFLRPYPANWLLANPVQTRPASFSAAVPAAVRGL